MAHGHCPGLHGNGNTKGILQQSPAMVLRGTSALRCRRVHYTQLRTGCAAFEFQSHTYRSYHPTLISRYPRSGVIKTVGQSQRYESGRGQPHSRTLRADSELSNIRQVLECGPLPLSLEPRGMTDRFNPCLRRLFTGLKPRC